MQSSECILVITCLLFLLHLGLHRYPSRLISHCQGWCPIRKFSRFLHKFFQILPLTVKILAFSIGFSFPFMYPFFLFYFFSPSSSLYVFPLSPPAVLIISSLTGSQLQFSLFSLFGSFFDSISVSLEFPFSICFPSNQCLSCLKLRWSSVCPVGYLPYCDKKDEFSSAFPADLKCCHPSNWR